MCGEFGEVSGIIDLVINFLAGGTLFLNSYDTLSYTKIFMVWSEPPECIRYIAIYFVLPSECDIWPAD